MSEYQYYEFQAIDRPLTREEQDALRRYSTRAEITASRFTNEYNWGDFKGDVDEWMDHYFDAFLYLANWGMRTLKLRLPAGLLDREAVAPYSSESMHARESGSDTVLTFELAELEEYEYVQAEGKLDAILGIRDELMRGDLRSLYLGWLMAVQNRELDDETPEPPVPAGLGDLTEAQRELVDFFAIDEDLLEVAAEASSPVEKTAPRAEIDRWLSQISAAERDDLLARLIEGEEPHLARALYARAVDRKDERRSTDRTAGELIRGPR